MGDNEKLAGVILAELLSTEKVEQYELYGVEVSGMMDTSLLCIVENLLGAGARPGDKLKGSLSEYFPELEELKQYVRKKAMLIKLIPGPVCWIMGFEKTEILWALNEACRVMF